MVLPVVAFYVFVSTFSDGAESSARGKVLVTAIVATVLLRVIGSTRPTLLGLGLACLAAAAVSLASLILWIRVTRLQALKITGSYIGLVVGVSLALSLIFALAA